MEESDEEQAGLFILGPEYYSNEFLINLSMISLSGEQFSCRYNYDVVQ